MEIKGKVHCFFEQEEWRDIKVFESMKVAMRETGVNKVTISMVCRGKRKIGGGYIWRYAARCI